MKFLLLVMVLGLFVSCGEKDSQYGSNTVVIRGSGSEH